MEVVKATTVRWVEGIGVTTVQRVATVRETGADGSQAAMLRGHFVQADTAQVHGREHLMDRERSVDTQTHRRTNTRANAHTSAKT